MSVSARSAPACLVLSLVLGLASVAGCSRVESPRPTPVAVRYHLVADPATLPLLRALANAYADANPHVTLTVESGNAAGVSERLHTGRAQLGAIAQVLDPIDRPWWLVDLAMDGVAVIVHPQNSLSALSTRDARDVFSGVRNQWAEYGVEGIGNIEVAVREDGDASRSVFDRTIMGDARLTLDALVMPSIETMLNYVALKPGAIGYAPAASVTRHPVAKALALEGQMPTPENVASGAYPLVRTLHLIAASEPQGELRNFVAWALGPHGHEIAASLGYAVVP
jgi:phosphate transport system substrate-binding protein